MPTSRDYKAALNNSISGVDGTISKCNCNFNYRPIRENWAFSVGGSWKRRVLKNKKLTFESGLNSVRQSEGDAMKPWTVTLLAPPLLTSSSFITHQTRFMKSSGRLWVAPLDFPPSFSNTSKISKNSRLCKLHLADTHWEPGTSECVPFSSPCLVEGGALSALRDLLWVAARRRSHRDVVIVPPRPREAQKSANPEDPGVRSTSDRSFSSRARRTAANIYKELHSLRIHSGSGWRMVGLCDKHKRAAGKPWQKNQKINHFLLHVRLWTPRHTDPSPTDRKWDTLDPWRAYQAEIQRDEVASCPSSQPTVRNYLWDNHIPSALGDAEHQIRLTALPFLLFDPELY